MSFQMHNRDNSDFDSSGGDEDEDWEYEDEDGGWGDEGEAWDEEGGWEDEDDAWDEEEGWEDEEGLDLEAAPKKPATPKKTPAKKATPKAKKAPAKKAPAKKTPAKKAVPKKAAAKKKTKAKASKTAASGELAEFVPEGAEAWFLPLPQRSLRIGFLAIFPLLVAYELSLSSDPSLRRTTAELVMGLSLRPLGDLQTPVRWVALIVAALTAFYFAKQRHGSTRVVGAGVARCWLEGMLAAIVLGPCLIGITSLLARFSEQLSVLQLDWDAPTRGPGLARAGRIVGGAAFEELFFRVGLYSLIFLLLRWFLSALFKPKADKELDVQPSYSLGRFGLFTAELIAWVGSSLLFAAAHLKEAIAWLGEGGEDFSPDLFVWRLSAGLLLAALFRWRGPGVAAWAHALFNLGLELGTGMDVLL